MKSECLNCGKEIKPKNKFCSCSCAATYNNKRKPRRKKIKYCLQCNSVLKTGSKYCDNKCKSKYENEQKVQQWLSGKNKGYVNGGSYELLKSIREWIFDRDNHKCECGCNKVNPYTGKSVLQIDHIDGDASNTRPENLKVICPTCHAMTKTYGNVGSRISKRRKWRNQTRSI